MDTNYENLVADERQKATRTEFVLFAFSRAVLFMVLTAGLGWVLRTILESLLLSIQHAFGT